MLLLVHQSYTLCSQFKARSDTLSNNCIPLLQHKPALQALLKFIIALTGATDQFQQSTFKDCAFCNPLKTATSCY